MTKTVFKHKNPFSNSRVDTPFQSFPDIENIYQNEYEIILNSLESIKNDENHQSKGVVVLGDAGSGKTHLIMRLAKQRLENNRLFFIRQPNNPDAVLYHIYNRMLESFFEKVSSCRYTQLELLLAKTLSSIVMDTILKGLIKFCTYRDPNRKEIIKRWLVTGSGDKEDIKSVGLETWADKISYEDFALEAISTFAKLSLVDEPLILVFDQLEGLKNKEDIAISLGEAIKEIFTYVPNTLIITNLFPDRWEYFKNIYDNSVLDRLGEGKVFLEVPKDAII